MCNINILMLNNIIDIIDHINICLYMFLMNSCDPSYHHPAYYVEYDPEYPSY